MFQADSLKDQMLKSYIQQIFVKYDTDKNGGLDVSEMTMFFNDLFQSLKINIVVTQQQAQQAIKSIDANYDGMVDQQQLFNAFKIMLNTPPQNTPPPPPSNYNQGYGQQGGYNQGYPNQYGSQGYNQYVPPQNYNNNPPSPQYNQGYMNNSMGQNYPPPGNYPPQQPYMNNSQGNMNRPMNQGSYNPNQNQNPYGNNPYRG